PPPEKEQHRLYVAVPGIRNDLEYGGVGILVYDIDVGYKFIKRIPTWDVPPGEAAENVKGTAASAKTGKLYVSTIKRVACFDLITEKKVWEKTYDGGSDRLAISSDGKILYVPSLEGPHWNVVDAATGDVIAKIKLDSGAHNTIYGPDGSRVYLAGLRSPILSVADTKTHTVVNQIGPFSNSIRPFTINGSRAYPSTGDVIDTSTKRIVTTLEDETGKHVQSEKLLEVVFANGRPVRAGDQFGIGHKP